MYQTVFTAENFGYVLIAVIAINAICWPIWAVSQLVRLINQWLDDDEG